MTDYEVTYILRPSLEENEVENASNAIADIIKNQHGEVVSVEKLGRNAWPTRSTTCAKATTS